MVFAFTACLPERDNPWDDKSVTDPSEWAPSNLELNVNSLNSITLSWQHNTEHFEGYKIDRKEGSGEWLIAFTTQGTENKTFTDNSVILTNAYTYRVYAYAGSNNSTYIEGSSTPVTTPTVTTSQATNITNDSAISGGDVTSDGGMPVTARGIVWSTSQNPTVETNQGITSNGAGTGSFTSNLTNLQPGTVYYVRAYATNSVGTVYGNQQTFTTLDGIITLTTTAVTSITATSAVSGGNITTDGGAAVTARGVVWSTSQNPTTSNNQGITSNGTGTGTFTSNLTGLSLATTYYVRAYASNSYGTQYGNQVSFTTPMPDGPGGTITDADGNTYNTIWINGRQWMKENLKTTKYNNGTSIPNVTDNGAWGGLSTPAYCWYNNDQPTYGNTYGALYNWYAVNTGNLCPAGWHVPTDAEWTALTDYVGGASIAGTKLKATSGWNSGGNGTDDFGFSALPGGYRRNGDGTFLSVGSRGYWWSSTESDAASAWSRRVAYDYGSVDRGYGSKRYGFSVRCVRDN